MRVLVVDDSAIFRKAVRDALSGLAGLDVVGVARDGQIALSKIAQLKPDLITLDVEMPVLDGIGVLTALRTCDHVPKVIVVSSLTGRGAAATTQALLLGAVDFVLKPSGPCPQVNAETLRRELLPKVEALGRRTDNSGSSETGVDDLRPERRGSDKVPASNASLRIEPQPRVIAIGVSTGGPAALATMIPKLPADYPLPILVVQHMPPVFTRSLADHLHKISHIAVCEAHDGQQIESGRVYIAPGGKQMKPTRSGANYVISVNEDPPEKSCRPSVDYLFRGVAQTYGCHALAVVMTGMGSDGTVGARQLKQAGSRVIVQDASSCVVYGMPRQIVDSNLADEIHPLEQLHHPLLHAIGRTNACR